MLIFIVNNNRLCINFVFGWVLVCCSGKRGYLWAERINLFRVSALLHGESIKNLHILLHIKCFCWLQYFPHSSRCLMFTAYFLKYSWQSWLWTKLLFKRSIFLPLSRTKIWLFRDEGTQKVSFSFETKNSYYWCIKTKPLWLCLYVIIRIKRTHQVPSIGKFQSREVLRSMGCDELWYLRLVPNPKLPVLMKTDRWKLQIKALKTVPKLLQVWLVASCLVRAKNKLHSINWVRYNKGAARRSTK